MVTFSEWYDKSGGYGMCPPPMTFEEFEKFLLMYLLLNYQIIMPLSEDQCRTQMLFDLLTKYSRTFEKEWKEYIKARK